MKTGFESVDLLKPKVIAVGVYEDMQLSSHAREVDEKTGGHVLKTLKALDFKGKKGKCLSFVAPSAWDAIAVVGLGKKEDALTEQEAQKIGAALVVECNRARVKELSVLLPDMTGELAAHVALGARLRSYRFDKYRTKEKDEDKPTLKHLHVQVEDSKAAKKAFEPLQALLDGVVLTRNLVSEPANIIYPESFAAKAKELEALGVKVEVLGEKEMHKLGMGALLGVGQGSARESQLVVMQWQGGKKDQKPLAFIGKGVTFDTGGISIKPSAGMEDMKWDMAGAATVLGLMSVLASRKAKVNVVCVAGLVENMPGSNAQRPGDVVKTMSGQTVEVINTDAEGRLVLSDAMWYTQDRFKPQCMVDLATLTGAIIIALGSSRAGLFSDNDELAERLLASGKEQGELLWRFPVGEEYEEHIKSPIADIKNVGKGREAGSISAAEFLRQFTNGVPWAHLDIAGVAWSAENKPLSEKGATAFGVRLLNHFVQTHYEG